MVLFLIYWFFSGVFSTFVMAGITKYYATTTYVTMDEFFCVFLLFVILGPISLIIVVFSLLQILIFYLLDKLDWRPAQKIVDWINKH
jgi:predicted PurR-regulated permease PerM